MHLKYKQTRSYTPRRLVGFTKACVSLDSELSETTRNRHESDTTQLNAKTLLIDVGLCNLEFILVFEEPGSPGYPLFGDVCNMLIFTIR